jgi:hypothetical protein
VWNAEFDSIEQAFAFEKRSPAGGARRRRR